MDDLNYLSNCFFDFKYREMALNGIVQPITTPTHFIQSESVQKLFKLGSKNLKTKLEESSASSVKKVFSAIYKYHKYDFNAEDVTSYAITCFLKEPYVRQLFKKASSVDTHYVIVDGAMDANGDYVAEIELRFSETTHLLN